MHLNTFDGRAPSGHAGGSCEIFCRGGRCPRTSRLGFGGDPDSRFLDPHHDPEFLKDSLFTIAIPGPIDNKEYKKA